MFEPKLTRSVAFQLLVEEVLAPALAIADLEATCRRMARGISVEVVNPWCVRMSTNADAPGDAVYTYLDEVALLARDALAGSPYDLGHGFEAHPVARQSRIAISW